MLQVKIIRNKSELMERDINEFLKKIGSQVGVAVKDIDIKYMHIAEQKIDQAIIIFNAYVVKTTTPAPQGPNSSIINRQIPGLPPSNQRK